MFLEYVNVLIKKDAKMRGHPGLNQGPIDLQSIALPLSYIPMYKGEKIKIINLKNDIVSSTAGRRK